MKGGSAAPAALLHAPQGSLGGKSMSMPGPSSMGAGRATTSFPSRCAEDTLVAEELGDTHLCQPDGHPTETLYLYKCKEVTFLYLFILAVYVDRVYVKQTGGRIHLDELGGYI